MIRLGRISYVNMAPVFSPARRRRGGGAGRPDRARTRALLAGEVDVAPIPSIEYGPQRRPPASSCRGSASPPRAPSTRSSSSPRCRSSASGRVAVTPESATSVVLARVLLPEAEQVPLDEEADGKLLIGDAALRSAFEDPTPHHDLGRHVDRPHGAADGLRRLGDASTRRRTGINELEDALVASVRQARAEPGCARPRGERALRLSAGLPRPLLREAALPVRPARARRALHVHGAGARRRPARRASPTFASSSGEVVPA